METFIGVKMLKSKPMTRLAYVEYRGWTLPDNEDGTDDGFLVEYMDGGKPNHPNHEGYISWSPKDVFEKSYRKTEALTTGFAVEMAKMGKKIARSGWNGKGMWVRLYNPQTDKEFPMTEIHPFEGTPACWLAIKTASNRFIPWVPSQEDVLAEDWYIVQ
jgi:hypothetical protein